MTRGLWGAFAICATGMMMSCSSMSRHTTDASAGFNGGFEVTHKGLPVNWIVYSPNTVADADFDVSVDTARMVEGKQSLKFDVRASSGMGGRKSPGIACEVPTSKGETFQVAFSIYNDGTSYTVSLRAVSAKAGVDGPTFQSSTSNSSWHRVEWEYVIPTGINRLRFELNVLSAGTLWIDDVTMTSTSD